MHEAPMHLISIATRCETTEAFLDLFRRYIDPEDHALFIAAPEPREVGAKAPFQIRLKNRKIVMRGNAEVVRRWTGLGEDSPWARPGYCVKLLGLEEDSQKLYDELISRSHGVAAIARQAVPPVFAEGGQRPGETPLPDLATPADPDAIIAEIAPKAPAASSQASATLLKAQAATENTNPLWGYLPPPPPPRPRVVELIRRSRQAQIVVGAFVGALVGGTLAFMTQGDEEEQAQRVSAETRVEPASPAPSPAPRAAPAPPAPTPTPTPPPAVPPAPEEAPEEDDDNGSAAKPRRVYLVLRSRPSGATFFIDGKKVGKAPTEIKVKAGKKVKVSAKLDGYAEWTESVRVKDKDRRISAKMEKMGGRFPQKRK